MPIESRRKRQHRAGAQQTVPSGLLRRQARAHRRLASAPTPCRSPRPPSVWRGACTEDLSAHNAFMVGAGDMNALTARHFMSAGRQAHGDRQPHPGAGAECWPPNSRPTRRASTISTRNWREADIVISCTASPVPLITKRAVEAAIRARRRRPIFMVDMAVPRDIEPAVADLEDVYLFSIDDLQQLVDENIQQREVAAGGARLLINEEVARFLSRVARAGCGSRPFVHCVSRRTGFASKPWSRRGACWPRANPPMKSSSIWPIPSPIGCCTPRPRPAPGGGTGRFGPRGDRYPASDRRTRPALGA